MADDCYDDEILLENSPLSQYLREACPDQEFDTIPSARKSFQSVLGERQTDCRSLAVHLHVIKEGLWRSFQWFFPPVSTFTENLNVEFLPKYAALAIESRCLLESDKQTVQAYQSLTGSERSYHHGSSSASHQKLWTQGVCALAFVSAALSVCVPHLQTSLTSGQLSLPVTQLGFTLVALLVSILYTAYWIHACWIRNSLMKLHRKCVGCIERCIWLLDKQGVLLRRSIRYIQEVEVISRGFTMVTSCTPIVRLENSTSSTNRRQCIVLRQCCFHTAKCQFNALRDATLMGMRQLPLLAEIDHVSNYLATVDLQHIAPWFKVDDEDELQDCLTEHTCNFSLSALKAMNSLFCEQRSEFIRRLVLCTSPAALLPHQTVDKNVLESWLKIVLEVNASCEESLGKLQRSYDCHRQRPSHNGEQSPSESQPQGGDGVAQHRVINAIRSLRLHLEATLNRVISVEEAVEGNDSTASQEGNLRCLTSEMLEAVKRELSASQDCLQEASSSLEKINDNKQSSTLNQQDCSNYTDQHQDMSKDNRIPIPLLPMRDSEIVFDDQVFEAYTENEPWERCDDDDWGEGISEQEKLRRRRDAEETKRMLQELRSVLSVRKAEREHMKLTKSQKRAMNDEEPSNPATINGFTESKSPSLNAGIEHTECRDLEKEISAVDVPNDASCCNQAASSTTSLVADAPALHVDQRLPSDESDITYLRNVCERSCVIERQAYSGPGIESEIPETRVQSLQTSNIPSLHNDDQLSDRHMDFRESKIVDEGQTQFRLPFNFLPSLAAEAAMKSRLRAEETFIGSDEESDE